ncbi:hypothetical protein M422DRAFT_61357 [Sphaerobolus stellatus SS14]|uniref:Vacuolar membrane-associated protein IML1 n=1 Tax=Sphaerobolus stellatus (strain SS14) TaxID=990650 RepID=A0A0C9VBK8_SPHS4|nr:hypothetical protein M422DRAFT_61357 [Sphaerobolus stellatus SS14]
MMKKFGKARWILPGEKPEAYPPPRFLPTYLGPAACLLDDTVVAQLEEIHALGPLKKKKNSEKVFQDYSLQPIAKAMHEEDGVPIKDHKLHGSVYPDSFTGANVTFWLVREFSDISTREQAVEADSKLHAQVLFEHCRRHHGFNDGHYFYRFKTECAVPRTPKSSIWGFRGRQPEDRGAERQPSGPSASPAAIRGSLYPSKRKKGLMLSQTMVIDADPNRRNQTVCSSSIRQTST